jgi:hypothetical protein
MASFLRRHLILATIVGAAAVGLGLDFVFQAVVSAENPQHAGRHLAVALPFAVVVVAAMRFWPRPRQPRIGRMARSVLVWGSALVVVGLVAEAIGAFGYDGNARVVPALTSLHNGSWPFSFLGAFLVLCSALLSLGSVLQKRTPSAPSETE